jgi:hypothetical protein
MSKENRPLWWMLILAFVTFTGGAYLDYSLRTEKTDHGGSVFGLLTSLGAKDRVRELLHQ